MILRGNWARWNRRLRDVGCRHAGDACWRRNDSVVTRERLRQRCGISIGTGCVLILATYIKSESTGVSSTAEAQIIVEARFIGTAIVVDDRLAKVIAVIQRRAANHHHVLVHCVQHYVRLPSTGDCKVR